MHSLCFALFYFFSKINYNFSVDFLDYCGFSVKKWLTGFSCVQEAVQQSVELVKDHPLLPKDVVVAGFIMDPLTGKLDRVEDAQKEKL